MKKTSMENFPTFISLFSGCGGFDLGFIQEDYKCLGAYDIDSQVLAVHEKNLKASTHQYDLSEGMIPYKGKVDVLLAGSPCQGFSTAGKRRLDDPRNQLLICAGKIAVELRPTVFVVENVPGVIAGKHRKYWDDLHQLLRESGYQTSEYICDSTELGLAQMRKRILTIAWRNNKDIEIELSKTNGLTLKDVIGGIDDTFNRNKKILASNSKDGLIANRIKQGQKLSNVRSGPRSVHTWDIPEVFGKTNKNERMVLGSILKLRRQLRVREYGDADPVPREILQKKFGTQTIESLLRKGYIREINGCYDLVHTFNGKYRRLSWNSPS